MASEILVDTSGFYALLVAGDDRHREAAAVMRKAELDKRRFVTTDYILDETATLLTARSHAHLLGVFFDTVRRTGVCRVEWMEAGRFDKVSAFMSRHLDQGYSFTDCFSFLVMKELKLRDALTKDAHFEKAGFTVLLA